MSETLDTTANKPEGKGLAVTGFILSLVGLIFNNIIFGIALVTIGMGGSGWLMYLWLVLNIASIILSVMGMSKLKKTGGKRGLGIAGMVIGIVGTVWAIILVLGLSAAAKVADAAGDDFRDSLKQELQKELDKE